MQAVSEDSVAGRNSAGSQLPLSAPIAHRILIPALCLLCLAAPTWASDADDAAAWCKRLTPRLPGVSNAMCQSSALVPTGAESLQNFPILGRHIPALTLAQGNKMPVRIMLLGGIHGDELTAASIVFKWMKFMPSEAAQQFEWIVVPVVNPDGLLASKPKRVNANGVDLNRNFPTPGWLQEAPQYWARKTGSDPRRFPGKEPLSEPESRWLNEEMERFQPQVIISVHAPYGVLDFDGPAEPPRRFGRLLLNRVGVYPGSLGNYSGFHKNVPVITIELPNARAMPSQAEVERIWKDMLKWIEANVEQQEQPEKTGKPVAVNANPSAKDAEDPTSMRRKIRKVWDRVFSWTRSQ